MPVCAAPVVAPLFAGVFTTVGSFVFIDLVYMHFAGRQPALEGSQQQGQLRLVTVPGDLPEASSFLQAMGSHETKGERSTEAQKFQVFVKNLAGKTVVVRGFSGLDEVSLVSHVESLTGVPRSLFYLVGASLWSSASGRCHIGAEWDWARLLSVHVCTAKGRAHEASPAVTATWVGAGRPRTSASGALRRDRRMGLSIPPPQAR